MCECVPGCRYNTPRFLHILHELETKKSSMWKRVSESENILINFHQILWKLLHLSTRAKFDEGKRNRLSREFRRVLHAGKYFQC